MLTVPSRPSIDSLFHKTSPGPLILASALFPDLPNPMKPIREEMFTIPHGLSPTGLFSSVMVAQVWSENHQRDPHGLTPAPVSECDQRLFSDLVVHQSRFSYLLFL